MTGKQVAACALAAGCVVALGCGKSKEAQAFDQVGQQCNALASQSITLGQADAQLVGPLGALGRSRLDCPAPGSIYPGIGGTCPVPTLDEPQCKVFYEWLATDPGLCSSTTGGCCFICELRVMKSVESANGPNTPVCASRWLSQQLCF